MEQFNEESHVFKYTNLILAVVFCTTLKKVHTAITAQTPYQKFLAYMFPSTWKTVSSRISPRKLAAWVEFEKSTPESLSGAYVEAPPIGMVSPISMLAVVGGRIECGQKGRGMNYYLSQGHWNPRQQKRRRTRRTRELRKE
jgi:hypothetical protein